ncbi:MAG: type I-U CRISPR-associated protein Cas5/Cas6 [Polyangiaceae bacterium]|nr:type I-U CRISPR-associated protein Cas5/Cas6 [Polyangiaceae bacterium]
MPATLLLQFPGGRFHATPHGHHVNEGLVEWPPSPWRLLRALIACGYSTQRWTTVPAAGRQLMEQLASTLPRYRVTRASLAHSRHYMPLGTLDKGREKTTLVFDAWADVGRGHVVVQWDCDLDPDAERLLGVLVAHLGYVGRSESWVLAEVLPEATELPPGFDVYPCGEGERAGREYEQVVLTAAEVPTEFARWRQNAVTEALRALPLPNGRRAPAGLLKKRATAEAPYPKDLLECLQLDTAWWKSHGWSRAPGSRQALYWRPREVISAGAAFPARHMRNAPVHSILLALTTPSGSLSALPPLSRALPQAELLHRALIARAANGERVHCPELTGKDEDGRPLEGHRHAHVLAVDLDGDGHIDHFIVHAPMGLGSEAQRAIRSLRRTWTKRGVGDLQLAVAGAGDLDDLLALNPPLGDGVSAILGGARAGVGARVWRTVTPFVAPRHVKRRGANTLEGQVNAELESRGLPEATVEVLPWDGETLRMRHAVRVRRRPAKPPPVDAGHALRLVFPEPVRGPLCLGYGSHFGLGLFQVDRSLHETMA